MNILFRWKYWKFYLSRKGRVYKKRLTEWFSNIFQGEKTFHILQQKNSLIQFEYIVVSSLVKVRFSIGNLQFFPNVYFIISNQSKRISWAYWHTSSRNQFEILYIREMYFCSYSLIRYEFGTRVSEYFLFAGSLNMNFLSLTSSRAFWWIRK